MPTTITLTPVPGALEQKPGYVMHTIDLFGPSLGTGRITVQRTADVTPAVRRFGEQVRALHPDASFRALRIAKGDRKPSVYDVADKAGTFCEDAFMRTVESREASLASFQATQASATAHKQGAEP